MTATGCCCATDRAPGGPPILRIHGDTFDMQIWLIESWTGTPVNVASDEHDAIGWFQESQLAGLRLAHDSYLAMFTEALAVS